MFITLTLNPAIDLTLTVRGNLAPGGIFPVVAETQTPGGKGVNVAKIIAANGKSVVAGGLLGRDELGLYERALAPAGVGCRFLAVPLPTRANVMITDGQGREMKLNRPGFPDLLYDEAALAAYARALATPGRIVVMSGSLPERFPADTYARLVRLFREAGCPVVLDASGPPLVEALREKPAVIKPNRHELETALGRTLDSEQAVSAALRKLAAAHEAVVLSDGARGAWFASGGGILFAKSPDVPKIDTTGAGDALLGQFCADYFPARALTPALAARAVAAGAAAVEQPGTPLLSLARIIRLSKRVVPVPWVPSVP
ncbi:MAG: 1-phosphofructokinase family hexose kinase [Kiritimatiellia bacterium]